MPVRSCKSELVSLGGGCVLPDNASSRLQATIQISSRWSHRPEIEILEESFRHEPATNVEKISKSTYLSGLLHFNSGDDLLSIDLRRARL